MGKDIVVFWNENTIDMWCSCRAPTEIKLMGMSGAWRQFVRVQTTVFPLIESLIFTLPIPRVVRTPQLAVFTGTAPSALYVWKISRSLKMWFVQAESRAELKA